MSVVSCPHPARVSLLLAGVTLLVACGGPPDQPAEGTAAAAPPEPVLEATGAFLFAPITEAQAGGYFVLHNRAALPDTLLEVLADWAAQGMVHETREEGGRVRMSHLPALAVPAHDSVVLQPGGRHVMLMRLSRMPVAGDTVEWTLRMSSGAVVRVVAPVVPYGREP